MHSIHEEYERRLALAEENIAREYRGKKAMLVALVACVLLSVTAMLLLSYKILLVLLILACLSIWRHHHVRKRWRRSGRERDYFQRGLDRLNGRWELLENDGSEYRQDDHVYQDDLGVLGPHSLFQLLCTVRTKVGSEHLAHLLLTPAPSSESTARQASVKELVSHTGLRETMASLGETSVSDCSKEGLAEWLTMPLLKPPAFLHPIFSICVIAACLLSLGVYCKLLALHAFLPWIAGFTIPPLCIGARYRTSVVQRLTVLRPISGSFTLLLEGMHLLEQQEFSSQKLRDGIEKLRADSATAHLRELARIFWWLEQREKPYFAFTILIALGTLIVMRAERWREQHGKTIDSWLDVWGTFEALQALACCAYEHPEWTFPGISAGPAHYQAVALGHPLLPNQHCVRNDVSLGEIQRYLFVSGSNMAGKSTLLRAVGLNAVLAFAGGPVCAESLELSTMQLHASIAVQDNLSVGRSRFMAEIQRIASAMTASRDGHAVLFLIDEILSGTNSQDRSFVVHAFLSQMLLADGLGMLTSHDLSLVTGLPSASVWHMASNDPAEPLRFDHKLKPGLLKESNGMALARLAGIII